MKSRQADAAVFAQAKIDREKLKAEREQRQNAEKQLVEGVK